MEAREGWENHSSRVGRRCGEAVVRDSRQLVMMARLQQQVSAGVHKSRGHKSGPKKGSAEAKKAMAHARAAQSKPSSGRYNMRKR